MIRNEGDDTLQKKYIWGKAVIVSISVFPVLNCCTSQWCK